MLKTWFVVENNESTVERTWISVCRCLSVPVYIRALAPRPPCYHHVDKHTHHRTILRAMSPRLPSGYDEHHVSGSDKRCVR